MGKFRSKLELSLIALLLLMGLFALGITVRVTITMLEKKDQIVENTSDIKKDIKAAAKPVYPVKLDSMNLYFNGRLYEGMEAYKSEKNNVFLPADLIAERLGGKLNFYSPDDVAEASFAGVKMNFKLGNNIYKVDNAEVGLPAAPIAAKNHILVPLEALAPLKGFTLQQPDKKGPVFLNYYDKYDSKEYSPVKLIKSLAGHISITDISESREYWKSDTPPNFAETYYFSKNGYTGLVRSGDKLYLIKYGSYVKPVLLDVNPSAGLTEDGRYLFWTNTNEKLSYVYDIGNKTLKKLTDYTGRIFDEEKAGQNNSRQPVLKAYTQGSGYKDMLFAKADLKQGYTIIERNKKVVIEGTGDYSPDSKHLLYYKSGKGYYTAHIDGKGITRIGEALSAEWITNRFILLRKDAGWYIYNINTKKNIKTENKWERSGITGKGEVLYLKGTTLYYDTGKYEKKIMDLPWQVRDITAASATGPFLAVRKDTGDVYFLSKGNVTKVADGKLLPDSVNGISISPDGKSFSILQSGEYINSVLVNSKGETNNVVLNISGTDIGNVIWPKQIWLNSGSILFYVNSSAWLAKISDSPMIYSWDEPERNEIIGVIPK